MHQRKHSTLITGPGYFVDSSGVAKWGIRYVHEVVFRWIETPERVGQGSPQSTS
jgi:hypothetical protein